jgi:hypothetical protein
VAKTPYLTRSQVPSWTHLRVQLCKVAENWDWGHVPDFQHQKGVEGCARSPGIRLGRGQAIYSLESASKPITSWLELILHPLSVRTSHGQPWTHLTHHSPDSGEATTFPHIVFSTARGRGYIQMTHFVGTPKLESRNCLETVPVGVSGLWELITLDCRVRLQQGLNQSCSPCRDLFNSILYAQIGCQEEVDSWLLVVESQNANLTPGPSFAHNLGWRCLNNQCKVILDIYVSRPFQWHQQHLNVRCFGPFCRTLNIRESQRTPSP